MEIVKMEQNSYHILNDSLRPASLDEHLKYTLRAALLTTKGERVLSPSLGSSLKELLFRPLNSSLKTEIEAAIRGAIEANEPRVRMEEVDLESDPTEIGKILVKIGYRISETQKRDKLTLTIG